ncbi:unnamed protein product [Spirodela intermedia]|uniref:Uncharacterized protein n=1 Tax=Spirodela intermedia TaxID=51605 RepID=A0A7I8JMK2_SPIIN|nr:unnamed protein product [Spirodela intermedia]CAA6671388.1 unnamed protein product [Spirodela intermedia]
MAKRVRDGTSGVQCRSRESSRGGAGGQRRVGRRPVPGGFAEVETTVGGEGGGMAVDYEELLWGWFPFVDEDFSCEGEEGWLCIWGYDEPRHALCE